MTLARRGGRRWLGLVVCGALLLAGCDSADGEPAARASGQPTATATRSFAPGASGAGDAYFPGYGNGGYDVAHYTVQVRYDPKTDQLTGTTVVRATATADLSAFNLDLAGLTVRSVTVNGVKAVHTRTGDELVITPAAGLTAGNGFVAEIRYDGVPAALRNEALGESGWLHTSDGAIALGQPESASTWFPVNDHPSDKATYDFEISVPKEPEDLKVISNGVFKGRTLRGDWATWSWSEGTPMASYLTMVVIGKFRVTTRKHKGRPVFNAVTTKVPGGPQDRSIARALDIADYLESLFGPYPFDAYGGVVVADDRIRYALETQTRPVYSTGFFRQGENTEVVAHEAGAPVVRQQCVAAEVAGHLAQRGPGHLCSVALGRAHRAVHRPAHLRAAVRHRIGAGLAYAAGEAGGGEPVQRVGVPARRDDRARAPGGRR